MTQADLNLIHDERVFGLRMVLSRLAEAGKDLPGVVAIGAVVALVIWS